MDIKSKSNMISRLSRKYESIDNLDNDLHMWECLEDYFKESVQDQQSKLRICACIDRVDLLNNLP